MSDTIFEKQGDVLTVKPKGRLDSLSSPVLEKELQKYLDNVQEVILDFSEVEYISSAGMRVVLQAEQIMEDCSGSLRLIHVNEHIVEIFELVGFMDIIDVETD